MSARTVKSLPCSFRLIRAALLFTGGFLLFIGIGSGTEPAVPIGFLFVVTTTDDHNDGVCDSDCTLREAILAADNAINTPDTIAFNVTGTINLTGPLPAITDSLTIHGPRADQLIISGGGGRIFTVTSAGTVSFSGLTISRGTTSGLGGGIQNSSTGTVNVTDCVLSDNFAMNGGGIANSSGVLNVTNTLITGGVLSSAVIGGGIYNLGTLNLTNSTISHHVVSDRGGGVFNETPFGPPAATATITSCTISGNSAQTG